MGIICLSCVCPMSVNAQMLCSVTEHVPFLHSLNDGASVICVLVHKTGTCVFGPSAHPGWWGELTLEERLKHGVTDGIREFFGE